MGKKIEKVSVTDRESRSNNIDLNKFETNLFNSSRASLVKKRKGPINHEKSDSKNNDF